MTARPLRRRDREASEDGFSLVEMMVATALLGLVFTVVMSVMVSTFRVSANTTNGTEDVGEVQNAMDVVTRDLRSGVAVSATSGGTTTPAVSAASPTSITLTTNLGAATGTAQVTFTLSGTTLTEYDFAGPGPSYSATPSRTVVLTRHISLPSGTSLFSYDNAGGSAIASPVASSDLASIASVTVTMVDDGGRKGANVATLSQQVWLRDLSYGGS